MGVSGLQTVCPQNLSACFPGERRRRPAQRRDKKNQGCSCTPTPRVHSKNNQGCSCTPTPRVHSAVPTNTRRYPGRVQGKGSRHHASTHTQTHTGAGDAAAPPSSPSCSITTRMPWQSGETYSRAARGRRRACAHERGVGIHVRAHGLHQNSRSEIKLD